MENNKRKEKLLTCSNKMTKRHSICHKTVRAKCCALCKQWNCCKYLQLFEFLEFGEEAGWQLTDAIFVDFQFGQLDEWLECAPVELHNLIVVEKSTTTKNYSFELKYLKFKYVHSSH